MLNNVTEKELTLNEWAKKYEVSSRYMIDTEEKREFHRRLDDARYLQSIGQWQRKQETPPETHSLTDRMVKVVSHILALNFN
jgi:hypothetical protein